jgi:hypothetical protein
VADSARLSISLPEEIAKRIRRAAARDRASVSAWLADAAESKLLLRNASDAIAAWEREHETITEEEMRVVARKWQA